MLNFYGIILVNESTGEPARNEEIYRDRFDNLLKHSHNENRISKYQISTITLHKEGSLEVLDKWDLQGTANHWWSFLQIRSSTRENWKSVNIHTSMSGNKHWMWNQKSTSKILQRLQMTGQIRFSLLIMLRIQMKISELLLLDVLVGPLDANCWYVVL